MWSFDIILSQPVQHRFHRQRTWTELHWIRTRIGDDRALIQCKMLKEFSLSENNCKFSVHTSENISIQVQFNGKLQLSAIQTHILRCQVHIHITLQVFGSGSSSRKPTLTHCHKFTELNRNLKTLKGMLVSVFRTLSVVIAKISYEILYIQIQNCLRRLNCLYFSRTSFGLPAQGSRQNS